MERSVECPESKVESDPRPVTCGSRRWNLSPWAPTNHMRRFSQRSSLVTLSEINITPLLDLAFVLLIIFVITTPLLEQGIPLKLPDGTGRPDKLERGDIRTVEISPQGIYMLNKRSNSLDQIEAQ